MSRTLDDRIFTCLKRHVERYDDMVARWRSDPGHNRVIYFPQPALSDWFKARYDYLHDEWLAAVNANASIIGKQWHYDYYHKQIAWRDR